MHALGDVPPYERAARCSSTRSWPRRASRAPASRHPGPSSCRRAAFRPWRTSARRPPTTRGGRRTAAPSWRGAAGPRAGPWPGQPVCCGRAPSTTPARPGRSWYQPAAPGTSPGRRSASPPPLEPRSAARPPRERSCSLVAAMPTRANIAGLMRERVSAASM